MNQIEVISQLKKLKNGCELKSKYEEALGSAIETLQAAATKELGNDKKVEINNLEGICNPVAEYLKNNYDPHCAIIITDTQIKLVRDEIALPVGTAPEVPVQEQHRNFIPEDSENGKHYTPGKCGKC